MTYTGSPPPSQSVFRQSVEHSCTGSLDNHPFTLKGLDTFPLDDGIVLLSLLHVVGLQVHSTLECTPLSFNRLSSPSVHVLSLVLSRFSLLFHYNGVSKCDQLGPTEDQRMSQFLESHPSGE